MGIKQPFNIPQDKWKHVVIGFMMIWLPILLGFYGLVAALIIALLIKEVIWDLLMNKGTFEWLDAIYTMIFPSIAYIVILLIKFEPILLKL